MHAYIFQISEKEIERHINVDTVTISDDGEIDYCDSVKPEEGIKIFDKLISKELPKGMFENVDDTAIRYLGGIEDYIKTWTADIKNIAKDLSPNEVLRGNGNFFSLLNKIKNPFGIPHLFYTDPDAISNYAAHSGEFISYTLRFLKPNDLLYIGGILDYHY